MADANNSTLPDKLIARRGPSALKGAIVQLARSGARGCMAAVILGFAAFLLCQCHRQSSTPPSTPASTATPTPTVPAPATPLATPTPEPTPVPAASTPPMPQPTPSPTPDPFAEGMKRVLQASEKGFLEFRGKFKKTENGSGPDPLFRVRKIYEGTFLFGGATSADIEEVYFGIGRGPAYNYHLYYQALSTTESIARYDDLRLNLNRVLHGFGHTFGERYDAWARADPLKTAVLLSSEEVGGSAEIQVHVAFSSPQW